METQLSSVERTSTVSQHNKTAQKGIRGPEKKALSKCGDKEKLGEDEVQVILNKSLLIFGCLLLVSIEFREQSAILLRQLERHC